MWETIATSVLAGAAGAAAGSFCATAAVRFAAGQTAWRGRSRCDGCARMLGWAETVPFVGFVRSGGVCRTCDRQIDPLHLWGEGGGALIAATAIAVSPNLGGGLLALVGLVLLAQSLIDIRTLRLPDAGNAMVAGLCAMRAFLHQGLLIGAIAAVASAALLFALKAWLERRRGHTMLGFGDIKLIAALALGLGAWTPYMIAAAAISALLAIFIRRMTMQDRLPFGPFIAFSGFVLLLISLVTEASL